MDFLTIIRALEKRLHVVIGRRIFYPRTLSRIIFNPAGMTLCSDNEQDDAPTKRCSDALSPPRLQITLVLSQVVELGFGLHGPKGHGGAIAKMPVCPVMALLVALVI